MEKFNIVGLKCRESIINQYKVYELHVESNVYAPLRGPDIPSKGYKGMLALLNKMLPTQGT